MQDRRALVSQNVTTLSRRALAPNTVSSFRLHGAYSYFLFFSFPLRFKTSRFAEPNRFETQRKRGKEENTQSSRQCIGKRGRESCPSTTGASALRLNESRRHCRAYK